MEFNNNSFLLSTAAAKLQHVTQELFTCAPCGIVWAVTAAKGEKPCFGILNSRTTAGL